MANRAERFVPHAQRDALWALVAMLGYWAVVIGIDWHLYGAPTGLRPEGVQWALAWTAMLGGGILFGALIGAAERIGRIFWQCFAVLTVFYGGTYALGMWERTSFEAMMEDRLLYFAMLGAAGGGVFGEHRLSRVGRMASLVAALIFIGSYLLAQGVLAPAPILQQERPVAEAVEPAPSPELYASSQDRLMRQQITALLDGGNGRPEIYALLVGGYAEQSVFLNEVEGVRDILDAQFGSAKRAIALVNSTDHPLRYPEVSWDNLDSALAALSDKMGPEDVLFFFLTSHGSQDAFAVTFHPASGRERRMGLASWELAQVLERHIPGPAVVVVSSCKSGSFVDDFATGNRLIITASAADRNSFGCRDGAEWTDFGHYFFNVTLREEPDPRKAFPAARQMIADAEWWRPWAKASEPQISEGKDFAAAFDPVLAQRSQ